MDDIIIDERKKTKNKSKKPFILVFSILGFVLLASGVFLGTYNFLIDKTSNDYEDNAKVLINSINDTNISVGSLNKEKQNAIDLEKARKELPSKIESLTKTKDKFQNLVPTESYKVSHETLLSGLDNNILVYRQIDAFLRNTNGKDIDKAGENLKKYMEECSEKYSLATSFNLFKISLPEESLNFVNNSLNYINEMVALQKDTEITQSQNLEFITSIDEILSKFINIKFDFSSQISKSRDNNEGFDNLIAQANKFRDDLSYLDQQLSNLSVPQSGLSAYNMLKNTFEDYDLYLQNITFALNSEKLLGEGATTEKIDELYSTSNLKFGEVKKNYDSFLKYYTDFKDSNIKS